MRPYFIILSLLFCISTNGQKLFDSVQVDKIIISIPTKQIKIDENVIRAIQTVDKKYRQIADTLYYYKSLKHTLFQTIFIQVKYLNSIEQAFRKITSDTVHYSQTKFNLTYFKNDTVSFLKYHLKIDDFKNPYPETKIPIDSINLNPLQLGNILEANNIIFDSKYLNIKIDSIAKQIKSSEKNKLFKYLNNNYDNFSLKSKKFKAQPVRLQYITLGENNLIYVGIDIYGTHFLWTIDKTKNWDVTKVESLWVY